MSNNLKRYFFDTEFLDPSADGFAIEFISLGIVAEDNRDFYGVYEGLDEQACLKSAWVKANVMAKLPEKSKWVGLDDMRRGIIDLIEPCDKVEFWAKNGTYDFYIMCRLFGGLSGLRDTLLQEKGIQNVRFCDSNDLRRELGYPQLPDADEADKHDALFDAQLEKIQYDHMMHLKNTPKP
ncbi:MAG: hypothetical protein ACTHPO_07405 [Alphaproteobacteria bacterium]|jgi:hypothetical protein|nr:hypothetical protein [Alphaproteobacteria bacterium]|tara:strand:- start:722 stop:1261 length:540 start_codon:yes stop_codon:yes gene_type:complete